WGRRGPRRISHPGTGHDRARVSSRLGHLLRRPGHPRREPDRPGDQPEFRTALPGPPAQEVPGDDAQGPGHGGDARGRGHRPLPHVVRSPGRLSREAAHRGEPGPDDAFAGTHRPWKVEQLGSAYRASSFIERTAYENADGVITVSEAMREDVHSLYGVPYDRVRIIHNGIDLSEYKPTPNRAVLAKYRIDPEKPFVLFVGRITRQKGIIHLVDAVKYIRPGVQVVLCAGAPDTKEIGREMEERVEQARHDAAVPIIWIAQVLPRAEIIPLYTHASVFVCPSVYEPFGIINLEAMACETPVVASAV